MTAEARARLAQIEARANAATEGSWTKERDCGSDENAPAWFVGFRLEPKGRWFERDSLHIEHEPDAEFIAASRSDVPWLIAELRAAWERDEALKAVVVACVVPLAALYAAEHDGTALHPEMLAGIRGALEVAQEVFRS